MKNINHYGAVLAAAVLVTTGAALATPAEAHTTGIHDNCTNLNKTWKHGVGRKGAVDKTSGSKVTNFYRNTKQYNLAVSHNGTLDRDKDGIACEKK
ncbi:excalibur calcium-binding domain-containing protein [Nocardioides sp. IC4_145]|uniref:excalibur calcium-binding domain-containing protein n=1 Tax=Nocardioides sp. IC4_145 TaxID=2714037 RepID=UPI00140C96B0|nr:excalibur calcium-binding domain-containing protein [Nocardioides sp. IC4_145]NHC22527.1 excalibur calcium-binding domain-containing protein [Nocardioides sp. IC4_145]